MLCTEIGHLRGSFHNSQIRCGTAGLIVSGQPYYAKRLLRSEWCSWRDVSVCLLFVRIFRDFYRRDMPIRRMLLSTETLPKIFHRPISVLKSNPRKVRLAITASLELTQNRDLFLELFLDFL